LALSAARSEYVSSVHGTRQKGLVQPAWRRPREDHESLVRPARHDADASGLQGVDTGAHYKRWPLEQSIAYMTANTPMAAADIERQIMRYYVLPGQALSYKVGMLTILDLRERARDQLGEDFDIREFHDAVLKNGAVPMQVLEVIVDDYIQVSKAGSAR